MTGPICGQCGNIISPFTDKTTRRPCAFRDIDKRWNGSDRLYGDTACIYYHERWKSPPDVSRWASPPKTSAGSEQMELGL